MSDNKEELRRRLEAVGQLQVLQFWDELQDLQRVQLSEQINSIDLELVAHLVAGRDESPNWGDLAERAQPPRAIRLGNSHNEFTAAEALARGEAELREGKVGMILVAGGQGTRLGFPHPKGLLPLGPLSSRTLFQIHIDRLRAVSRRYGKSIPLYVMTSPRDSPGDGRFLADHDRFGLAPEDLQLFCQGMMPAVDAATGKILLSERWQLALNPDGHGGMLRALALSGCLDDARQRGIQRLFYGQVDNPLLQICDPLLIGYHVLAGSEMTTQVVAKRDPLDRVGNLAMIDGRTQIIEYSDLPEKAARRRDPDGTLYFWAGSIAVHVFDVQFLERMAGQTDQLPFHRAHKKSAYIDANGNRIQPHSPNSIKFERFIFDLLPFASNPIAVEGAAEEVFAPVKNAAGAPTETIETARAALVARDTRLLQAAGVHVAPDVPVEINPLWAFDAARDRGQAAAGDAGPETDLLSLTRASGCQATRDGRKNGWPRREAGSRRCACGVESARNLPILRRLPEEMYQSAFRLSVPVVVYCRRSQEGVPDEHER